MIGITGVLSPQDHGRAAELFQPNSLKLRHPCVRFRGGFELPLRLAL